MSKKIQDPLTDSIRSPFDSYQAPFLSMFFILFTFLKVVDTATAIHQSIDSVHNARTNEVNGLYKCRVIGRLKLVQKKDLTISPKLPPGYSWISLNEAENGFPGL